MTGFDAVEAQALIDATNKHVDQLCASLPEWMQERVRAGVGADSRVAIIVRLSTQLVLAVAEVTRLNKQVSAVREQIEGDDLNAMYSGWSIQDLLASTEPEREN